MRGHRASDEDVAASTAPLDAVDAQPHHPVVDEHVVSRLEHRSEHRRADRDVAVLGGVLAGDHDGVAVLELDVGVEVTDAQLGALEVGDQRDRASR